MLIQSAEELLNEIENYFYDERRSEYPTAFASQRVKKEGWFQGELCHLFTCWQNDGRLTSNWVCELSVRDAFSPEFLLPKILSWRGKDEAIDFSVTINQEPIYLEVKAPYVDLEKVEKGQGKTSHRPFSHIRGDVKKDIRKLQKCKQGQRFCILFIYPRPKAKDIKKFVEAMEKVGATLVAMRPAEESSEQSAPTNLLVLKLKVLPRKK